MLVVTVACKWRFRMLGPGLAEGCAVQEVQKYPPHTHTPAGREKCLYGVRGEPGLGPGPAFPSPGPLCSGEVACSLPLRGSFGKSRGPFREAGLRHCESPILSFSYSPRPEPQSIFHSVMNINAFSKVVWGNAGRVSELRCLEDPGDQSVQHPRFTGRLI